MAPNSDGIQKLLAAEQEASRIVAEARKGVCQHTAQEASSAEKGMKMLDIRSAATFPARMPKHQQQLTGDVCLENAPLFLLTGKAERLRQAKAEAEKEISAYRAEREGAYQKKLAEVRCAEQHAATMCFISTCPARSVAAASLA